MTPEERRGHAFSPRQEDLAGVPRLYATEDTPLLEKVVWLHYFVGACDWYVVELGEDQRIAFGWVDLGDPNNAELGYIDLLELRELMVQVHGMPVVVERDLEWMPTPLGDVLAAHLR